MQKITIALVAALVSGCFYVKAPALPSEPPAVQAVASPAASSELPACPALPKATPRPCGLQGAKMGLIWCFDKKGMDALARRLTILHDAATKQCEYSEAD